MKDRTHSPTKTPVSSSMRTRLTSAVVAGSTPRTSGGTSLPAAARKPSAAIAAATCIACLRYSVFIAIKPHTAIAAPTYAGIRLVFAPVHANMTTPNATSAAPNPIAVLANRQLPLETSHQVQALSAPLPLAEHKIRRSHHQSEPDQIIPLHRLIQIHN